MTHVVVAPWTRYRKLRHIGSGAMGQVFVAEALPGQNVVLVGEEVVIKRMFLDGHEETLKAAATEVKIMEALEPHPNVVRYYEHFFDTEGCINIVMEYCHLGNVEGFIRLRHDNVSSSPPSVCEIVYLAFQLLAAAAHLHRNGIVHRDLKPANVFLTHSHVCSNDEERSDVLRRRGRELVLKVADFGVSRILERTSSVAKTVIGTPFYIAPELCNGESYGNTVDVWAIGCMIFEVATGKRCFDGDNLMVIVRRICAGEVPPLSPTLQPILMPMLKPMLQVDASARFTADLCLRAFFMPEEGDNDFADEFEDPDE
jgi:NIMA (never in mitosis gene a)-related kinase